ncbi:MAG: cytochrome P460 family protein [Acidobacteria bacterium]|nr:cytochrome P460 family protein [Acidobacteriota bacterium]
MRVSSVILSAFGLLGGSLLTGQAPTVDRVGFPTGYKETFKKLLTVDRLDNGQIRVIWANDKAAGIPIWENYPYGSVLLFESYTSKRDPSNNLMLDADGRLIPDTLSTLFVKRKEMGFGEAYGVNRNGEWEYVAYRPDGSLQTAPQASAPCAACHAQAGPPKDWTFRRDRFQRRSSGAAPLATMSQYQFLPGNLTVKKGTVITWYNDDEIEHQIYFPLTGANSDPMSQGASYTVRFDEAGEFDVRCTIHAGMRAKVKVEP